MMKRVDIGTGHERLIGGGFLMEHRLCRETLPLDASAAAGGWHSRSASGTALP
jgi:hypothetical protein